MKLKDRMIKFAKDYYAEIGYPISKTARFEFKKNWLHIFENFNHGEDSFRAVVNTEKSFEIFDFRGRSQKLVTQDKTYLPY